jgi:N-methylhydantoinase A
LHEQKVVDHIKNSWPDVDVVSSHQINREWREYERSNTTVLCAHVKPIARNYLDKLSKKLKESNFSGNPYVMQSNGGIDTFEATKIIPLTMIESGPTSGVLGAAELGKLIEEKNIISLDVGGTTAKCSLIENGNVKINTNYWIEKTRLFAGYPVMLPVVDIVEIGSGGGSIAWVDDYNKLHVGPQSAGADPGPVSYGKGGNLFTTKDANLATNRINPNYFCGGEIKADMNSVNKYLEVLAKNLNLSIEETSRGIIRIANNNMINALKLVSVNKGYDPRDFTLVAFGGGGGMHAVALAQELGVKKVIIPAAASVFSAWGMMMSDLRRDHFVTHLVDLTEGAASDIESVFSSVELQAIEQFQTEGIDKKSIKFIRYGNFRYKNQEHTTEVRLSDGPISEKQIGLIEDEFHNTYEREYTYRLDTSVELVGIHVVATSEVGKLTMQKRPDQGIKEAEARKGSREVDYALEGVHKATLYNGEKLLPGMEFNGPAIIEDSGATTVIHPGNRVRIDGYTNIHIEI